MQKIIRIIQWCVAYSSDQRLTANQLLQLAQNLESDDLSQIITKYEDMIKSNSKSDSKPKIEDGNYKDFIEKLNEQKSQIEKLNLENSKLKETIIDQTNEHVENKKKCRKELNDMQTQNENLRNALQKCNL